MPKKNFKDLTEREILALAIQLEEEDSRVYADFAEGLNETYPGTAKVFLEMQAEESRHRQSLIDLYQTRFGDHIPLIRRHDVRLYRAAPRNMDTPLLSSAMQVIVGGVAVFIVGIAIGSS